MPCTHGETDTRSRQLSEFLSVPSSPCLFPWASCSASGPGAWVNPAGRAANSVRQVLCFEGKVSPKEAFKREGEAPSEPILKRYGSDGASPSLEWIRFNAYLRHSILLAEHDWRHAVTPGSRSRFLTMSGNGPPKVPAP